VQDFGHGFGGAQADSTGLVIDEPSQAAEELAHGLGVVLRDSRGGCSHGLDRAPADPGVRVVGQGHEASERALAPRRQLGDFVETPPFEEFV
jgi:hypothetical protein